MNSTTSDVRVQMHGVGSGQSRQPLLHLLGDTKPYKRQSLEESREIYMKIGVPLCKLALKGDWNKDAKRMLRGDSNELRRTAITRWQATALHVAAGANRVHFVQELVRLMRGEDLELQDQNGNTAFFLAAGVGNRRLAEIMITRNKELPTIRGQMGFTPLHFAVMRGRSQMTKFLYNKTTPIFQREDWETLFLNGINAGMFDLALGILVDNRPWLAIARNENNDTGLHLLARKKLTKSLIKQTRVLQLVRRLWTIILTTTDLYSDIREIINNPSPLIFDAVLVGNSKFLAELLSTYPDLIWERDCSGKTIIHLAVEQRHSRIFSLIHEMGSTKDLMALIADKDDNTLLHLAAKLAPSDQLNMVSGAAFQLTLELIWFKEVEKIMLPITNETINSEQLTATDLFTREHRNLHEQAEKWIKGTAKSCMVVSTVITAGVFSALFNLPGGSDHGNPTRLEKPIFTIFSISNAIALTSSAASILIFLSILISRYAERDFYMSLPLKLIFGIITQFISIASMMIAFSSALFIWYYDGRKLVPDVIFGLAFLIIFLSALLLFPLLYHTLKTICFCRYLFWKNRAYICY